MRNGLNNYNTTNAHGGITLTWDTMQQNYHCCGIKKAEDWGTAAGFSRKFPGAVPDSCCKIQIAECGKDALKNLDERKIYTTGCFEKFATDVESNVGIAGAVGGVLGAVQLIAILVTCCLGKKMANRRYEDYDHSPSAPLYATY